MNSQESKHTYHRANQSTFLTKSTNDQVQIIKFWTHYRKSQLIYLLNVQVAKPKAQVELVFSMSLHQLSLTQNPRSSPLGPISRARLTVLLEGQKGGSRSQLQEQDVPKYMAEKALLLDPANKNSLAEKSPSARMSGQFHWDKTIPHISWTHVIKTFKGDSQ